MGDLEDTLNALKKADASGNTADATRLATIADKLSKQNQPEQIGFYDNMTKFGSHINRGIAMDDPFLAEQMGKVVPTAQEPPQTASEHIASGIGQTVGAILPMSKTIQIASKGANLTGRISKMMWEGITKHPYLAMASEVTGGAGMGTGRFVAEEFASDKQWVRPLAEMVGGMTGGFAPTLVANTPRAVGFRYAKEKAKELSLPFTERGSKYRAGKFMKGQVADPEATIKEISSETVGDLPPAVASGQKRLIALYNSFKDADPITDQETAKKIAHSIHQLERELHSMGYGAPEVMKAVTAKRVAGLELKMNRRIIDAMETAQDKLSKLKPSQRKANESIVVRDELKGKMKLDKEIVDGLWGDVKNDVMVDYSASKESYDKIIKEIAKAKKVDIPHELKISFLGKKAKLKTGNILDATGKPIVTKESISTKTTVKEIQGLRSKLLEVERIARSEGKWNKARIAGDVADSLLDDMSKVDDGALQTAIETTSVFHDKYSKGIVGKILGTQRTNTPKIDPKLTLDVSIGRQKIKGGLDLEKVVVTPEAHIATKRYITRSFTDFATTEGTKDFNAIRAKKWIANNSEVLDQYPDLKAQMDDTASAFQLANDTQAKMLARQKNLKDPRISTSSRFLNAELGEEVTMVYKKPDSVRVTQQLVQQARKDPTGEALDGLKGSYVDHAINNSLVGQYNMQGEKTLSGRALLGYINTNRRVLREVLSQDELNRMTKIADELVKIDMIDVDKLKPSDLEWEDIPSNLLKVFGRVAGAQIGRVVARATGGGTVQTPAIFSERFRAFANKLTKDRAFELVHDAIMSEDDKLLRTLLLPIDKPQTTQGAKNIKIINQRMNAWLLGTGSRVMRDIEQEMREDKGDLSLEKPQGSQSTLGGATHEFDPSTGKINLVQ